jgi:hypothetical protein
MPKMVHSYPDEDRLEVLVLANSPCTPSEILRLENIPVKPNTLETIKKRMDFLCKVDKLRVKKIAKGNVYWHSGIEAYKKNALSKATEKLVQTEVAVES